MAESVNPPDNTGTPVIPLCGIRVLLALFVVSILLGPCAMAMDMDGKEGTPLCMAGDDCHLFSARVPGDNDKALPFGPKWLPEAKLRSYLVQFPAELAKMSLPRVPSTPEDSPYLVTRRLRL